ncbi:MULTISPECIES: acetyl-CoA C-acyltransferase family protein [unclassified Pseudomonas]|uniref:acetyl-CoA C-acyltransferase family protein n=1 Tax=unclassified Pseudomonas TaxID=196821 RepID=UPI000A1ED745|nr:MULTISPECIES: acetyl-CoA C-acyltransferase family protein [unclassified Pseudomonas]
MTQAFPEIVVAGAARTAIGSFGGALRDQPPCDLATLVVKEAIARAQLSPAQVGQIVLGNVLHTEPRDMYVSRVAGLQAGMDQASTALTVNRLCGSGLQALVSAANAISLGDCEIAIGGGVESMSRSLFAVPAARWGARMGDSQLIDMMTGALNDPFGAGAMGITAENVAGQYEISREEQDAFALESQRRATAAIAAGHFRTQIVPVQITTRKGTLTFDTDEYPKADANLQALAGLRPAFRKDGSVTAGNSSGINDGAAACVLMSAAAAQRQGIKPLARMLGYAVSGVDPAVMGTGPIPAVRRVLERTGLALEAFDVIESNEAFAAQALGVCRGLGLDPARTNPNGGAIALGHPLGASGTILAIKCIYELQRIQGRYGLVTMCIGGGQGIAVVFERL